MTDLGTDISTPVGSDGVIDLDPTFAVVSGRTALVQALARAITTQTGVLAWIGDDPDYGMDVRDYLGGEDDARTTFVVASKVETTFLRDERVTAAKVDVTVLAGRMTIAARVADSQGPFRFVLVVSAVSVETLRVF